MRAEKCLAKRLRASSLASTQSIILSLFNGVSDREFIPLCRGSASAYDPAGIARPTPFLMK